MDSDNKVIYNFYSKPISSFLLALIMPHMIKKNSLVQEGIRRLRKSSRSLDWKLKADIMSVFSNKIRVLSHHGIFLKILVKLNLFNFMPWHWLLASDDFRKLSQDSQDRGPESERATPIYSRDLQFICLWHNVSLSGGPGMDSRGTRR